ncbi:hypothetical protein CQW23_13200 [Capsicum baccatum]|uniref:NB-ARC domain-containing protein n=1 Tax=Capsicum baccatum TaxID=33114 RepID=A0A2G2WUV6_CAPBA|nr:hypothetical protein CQW23_13200 [Capsicum baccatum]
MDKDTNSVELMRMMEQVSSVVLCEEIVNLLDFIDMLKNEEDHIVLDTNQIEKLRLELTFLSACLQLCYYISDGSNADMSYRQSESSATMTEDQLVELLDAVLVNLHYLPKVRAELFLPSMTQYELLLNVFGNLRDSHRLKVNGFVEHKEIEYALPQLQLMAERVGNFCFVLLSYQLDKTDETDEDGADEEDEDGLDDMLLKSSTFEVSQVKSMLVHLLLKITPVSLEVMHICSTILETSKSSEVGHFIQQLLEASPDILREHLIHLQQHMVNAIPRSTSASNIHVMIEFLLIILTDMPKDFIHYEKLFVLLAGVGSLIREVSILIRNLEENSTDEENMNKISCAGQDLLENIELLKEDLRHVFLKAPADSSQRCFPMSDGPLFMTLLLRNLNDLVNSNAYSQELHRDLWIRVLDVSYEAEHAINSILARDRVDQERNEKKLLQKVFNEVIGLKERVREDDIDYDVADKLRRQLFGKRYLIVLDDLWDTATWDELTRPLYAIPSEFQKGSRVSLTSQKKEVALHGKCHSDPLDLRLLRPEESWELFEKRCSEKNVALMN